MLAIELYYELELFISVNVRNVRGCSNVKKAKNIKGRINLLGTRAHNNNTWSVSNPHALHLSMETLSFEIEYFLYLANDVS